MGKVLHHDLALKCPGLDDSQARTASAKPSTLTLLGLAQHLAEVEAEVERNWFQRVFAGLDEALDVWRREIARGRELRAGRSLDDTGRIPGGPLDGVEGTPTSCARVSTVLPEPEFRVILNSLSMDGLPEFFCPLFAELNRGDFIRVSTL